MKKFLINLIIIIFVFLGGYFTGKYKPEWLEYDYWKKADSETATGAEIETEQDEIENVIRNIHKDKPAQQKNKQKNHAKKTETKITDSDKQNQATAKQPQSKTVKKQTTAPVKQTVTAQPKTTTQKKIEKPKSSASVLKQATAQTKQTAPVKAKPDSGAHIEDSIQKVIIDIDSKK